MEELKTGSIIITGKSSNLRLGSNMYIKISEIIDNSISSLCSISEINANFKNFEKLDFKKYNIEIFFIEKSDERTDLIITDNCGGIEVSDESIENVMTYQKNKDYKEPFLNIFGVGLKEAAIWSSDEFTLKSFKDNKGFEVNAVWEAKSTTSEEKYTYNINDLPLKFLANSNWAIENGTQIIFGKIDKEKFLDSNIRDHLADFIGWRYSKYIKQGLNITLIYQNQDGSNSNMKLKDNIVTDRAPKYESFMKYFNWINSKNNNKIDRHNFNMEIREKLLPTLTNDNLKNKIEEIIKNDSKLEFEEIIEINYKDKVINFNTKVGILEFFEYNKNKYADNFGISVYQAKRALKHGPNSIMDNYKLESITTFPIPSLTITGGKKTVFQRFAIEIEIDDYIKKFSDQLEELQSVISSNKENFIVKKEIWDILMGKLKINYINNLSDFLVTLNNIQSPKVEKDKIYITGNTFDKEKLDSKMSSFTNITNIIGGSCKSSDFNKDLKILFSPIEIDDTILFDIEYSLVNPEDKYVEIFLNQKILDNYNQLIENSLFRDMIFKLFADKFLQENDENDKRSVFLNKFRNRG